MSQAAIAYRPQGEIFPLPAYPWHIERWLREIARRILREILGHA